MRLLSPSEWSPTTRRIVFAVAATAVLLLGTRYERFEDRYCAICASERKTNEWGFGLTSELRVPLVASDVVIESAAFRNLCGTGHEHVWRTDHTWDTNWFGGCCACGGWDVGPFARQYERSEDLRAVVQREIVAGTLDRATTLRLVAVPRSGYESKWAVPGTAADPPLLAVADRLLRASGGADGEVRWQVARMARAPADR